MPKKIDYTGYKIGRLTFLESFKLGSKNFWKIQCECGNTFQSRAEFLNRLKKLGRAFECKECKYKRKRKVDFSHKYGRLQVIKQIPSKDNHHLWFLCLCDCGKYIEINGTHLTGRKKSTKSCGCWARKIHSRWINTTQYPPSHGFKKNKNYKSLDQNLYHIRNSIVAACYRTDNRRYKDYGDKGKKVCDLWRNSAKDFVKWAKELGYKKGDALAIKDGFDEFCPENCYLITKNKLISKNNTSTSVTFKGESLSISQWARKLGTKPTKLWHRIKAYQNKFGIEKAMDIHWKPQGINHVGNKELGMKAIELYLTGKGAGAVAKKLGCSNSLVYSFLKKEKVQMRPPKRPKESYFDKEELALQGKESSDKE